MDAMPNEQDSCIDTFWRWIQHNAQAIRSALLTARSVQDLETIDAMAAGVYEQVASISEELLVDLHFNDTEILLTVRTGLPDRSLVDRILARAPTLPGWRFAPEIPRDLESVIARDGTGREMVVPYAALSFAMTKDEPSGKHTILIVFDGDFELGGPVQHLFNEVAARVLTTLIGRIPSTVGSYSLVPARMARGVKTRPIFDLPSVLSLP
jgi:hypothetical protein